MKNMNKDSYLTLNYILSGVDKNKVYDLRVVNGELALNEVTKSACTFNLTGLTASIEPPTYILPTKINFKLFPKPGYLLPEDIVFSSNIKDGTYNKQTGEVSFTTPLRESCSITATGVTLPWYDAADWWNYCSNGVAGSQASEADIGREVFLMVDTLTYKVRLIGIDHDDRTDGQGKAHCTFEFVELWSKSDGSAIAQAWDPNAAVSVNWESCNLRTYMNNTVYNALPADIRAVLKPVNKVTRAASGSPSTTVTLSEKVFPLSVIEAGGGTQEGKSDEGSCYQWYSTDSQNRRIKSPINGTATVWRPRSAYGTVGSYYGAFLVDTDGSVYSRYVSYSHGVPPCFCI